MPTPDLSITTYLDPHMRGDRFEYSNSLQGGYVASNFNELWFTLRTSTPASTTTDDTGAVAQAKMTTSGIVFSDDTALTVAFADTRAWPKKRLYWDLQGRLT